MRNDHKESSWNPEKSNIVSIASDIYSRNDIKISAKLLKYLIKEDRQLNSKKFMLMTANSLKIILGVYCLVSLVNIEAYNSFLHFEEIAIKAEDFALLYYISMLEVIHFLRIFNSVSVFFGINLKSKRIVTYFVIIASVLFLIRSILTILIIISYTQIKQLCDEFFYEDNDVGHTLALQYCIMAIMMLCFDSVITLICIVQASNSKEQYILSQHQRDKINQKYFICYDNALNSYF